MFNDKSMKPGVSNDVWPGSANPTTRNAGGDTRAANFIDDPTTGERGAGAPSNFTGDRAAKKAMLAQAGVIESQPGIIETTNIDPLNQDSNKDDGWAGHSNTKRPDKSQAGVIEAHPGIIESTNIDPLNENSNKDDGWANTSSGGMMNKASGMASSAVNSASTMATGAAKAAYGTATGRRDMAEEGKRDLMG